MVPELTNCEECGRTVIVLSWSLVDDADGEHLSPDAGDNVQITCLVDCPACGPRSQTMDLPPLDPCD